MISETEKPPLQLDVLNSFQGAKFISIVDLNNAYFQIPISDSSKKYTGFSFNGKSYVYNVLPQGLKTSVGSFSRAMDFIIGHEV
ncbi:reverse transcriptase domain-containing protein, partial [Proteus terrae]|uniref:reverse transcriptase domain-containing protein n=1 Tax=Proteus terrae TaxID=1574161 RepID=UPI00301B9A99